MPDLPPLRPSSWTFRKLRDLLKSKGARMDLSACGDDFRLEIVGESQYQDVLKGVLASSADGRGIIPVAVQCEPNNKFDANAVRISTMDGRTIG